jgi:hypothetical protein
MATRAKLPRLNLRPEQAAEPQALAEPPAVSTARRDREGKKLIAGHFPKATWAELRHLSVVADKTGQELLEEALADLFAKYRR